MIRRTYSLILLLVLSWLLVACGPERPVADEAVPTRTPRPTFTPTPVQAAVQQPVAEQPVAEQPAQQESAPDPAAAEQEPTPEPPTPTPEPEARAVVTSPLVNVRAGPGTQYDLAGQVDRGAEFRIVGKNPAGDWWQICCVDDRTVWIAGFLVDATGPVDSVAVASDIPAAPPTPTPAPVVVQPTAPPAPAAPTATPAPAEPEPTPAPAFSVNKAQYIEPRPNSNPVVTFFGTLCKQVCPGGGGAGGYQLIVEGPHGRSEGTFSEALAHGDPGLPSEFIYNVKIEIPGGPPGGYKAYVADSGGNQVSEAYEYTVQGDIRTFLPRWVVP